MQILSSILLACSVLAESRTSVSSQIGESFSNLEQTNQHQGNRRIRKSSPWRWSKHNSIPSIIRSKFESRPIRVGNSETVSTLDDSIENSSDDSQTISIPQIGSPIDTTKAPIEAARKATVLDCLSLHNTLREQNNSSPLSWDDGLENTAQQWANQLTANGTFEHSNFQHGENLYLTFLGDVSCAGAVGAWASEQAKYDGSPISIDNVAQFGHYTQMVWSRTTAVGCAFADNGDKRIWVCEYEPPGNILGERP